MAATVAQIRPVRLRYGLGPGFAAGTEVTAHGTHQGLVVIQSLEGVVAHVLPDVLVEPEVKAA